MHPIWQNTQAVIQTQVNERTWEQFFQHLVPREFHPERIVFEVPDAFFATWFSDHYLKYLKDVLHDVTGETPEVQLVPRGASPYSESKAGAIAPVTLANDTMSLAQNGQTAPLVGPPKGGSPFLRPELGMAPHMAPSTASLPPGAAAYPTMPQATTPQNTAPQAMHTHGAPAYMPTAYTPEAPHAPQATVSQSMHAAASHASMHPGLLQPQTAVTSAVDLDHEQAVLKVGLNPRYTFEQYVVGGSNQFSYAACRAIAERPARAYNPLFLYGGVGLGKTHLLHAVGVEVLRRWPHLRVTYVSSEKFMNELIHSLRTKDTNSFRKKYRDQCDLLLMDDIQFIAGKDSTQEEFFHTFNALYQAHRQIVITSDKLPGELPGLEERLRSRFGWGLIADIQPPDIETRIAIIRKKAEEEELIVDNDVAMYLATHIRSNVRELEGSLVRLKAFASLYNKAITLDMARTHLKNVIIESSQHLSIEKIQRVVASYFNVKVKELIGRRRHRVISHPRHVAMYLSRHHTDQSFPEIGKHFGGRDHSTVMNAVGKIEKGLLEDDKLKEELRILEKSLRH